MKENGAHIESPASGGGGYMQQLQAIKKIQRAKLDRTLDAWYRNLKIFCMNHLRRALRMPHANPRRILTWMNHRGVRPSYSVKELFRTTLAFAGADVDPEGAMPLPF